MNEKIPQDFQDFIDILIASRTLDPIFFRRLAQSLAERLKENYFSPGASGETLHMGELWKKIVNVGDSERASLDSLKQSLAEKPRAQFNP